MSGSYRYIVIALVGWLGVASPSEGKVAASDKPGASEGISAELASIRATLQKLPKAQAPDTGCDPTQEKRESDLCAQWKAADAAAQSADWTARTFWAGLVGLLIGTATLVFAARAAHWAKEAARHTEAGAKEGKRAADAGDTSALAAQAAVAEAVRSNELSRTIGVAQIRAYISVLPQRMIFTEARELIMTFRVTNSGSSPAKRVEIKIEGRNYEPAKGGQLAQSGCLGIKVVGAMAANSTSEDLSYTWEFPADEVNGGNGRNIWTKILFTATYRTVFDDILGEDIFEYRPFVREPGDIKFVEHGSMVLHAY